MIRLEGITHHYDRVRVLHGIDLGFEVGQVSAVCGPNAAGKTTLLRIAAGLLKPSGGRVILEDRPIAQVPPGRRAFMSQRFDCASGFSVRRILELARVLIGRDHASLDRVIEAFELDALLDRGVGGLSVGQCQRVALARALAQVPHDGVVILDEPLAALDPRWARRAADILRQRAAEGATILLSVHELPVAARLADHVVLLSDGGLVANGPVETVFTTQLLERAYGIPFELLIAGDGSRIPIASKGI
jgi:iron complex transport system ATP-binding protein